MTLKEDILRLRAEGKTYKQIREELDCAKSTISYYCGEGQRAKTKARQDKRREGLPLTGKLNSFKYNTKGINNKFTCFKNRGGNDFDYTYNDILEIVKKTHECYLCGRGIDYHDSSSFNFDHIVPVSQGGLNNLENLGIACRECNSIKTDLLLEDFFDLCYDILKHNKRI